MGACGTQPFGVSSVFGVKQRTQQMVIDMRKRVVNIRIITKELKVRDGVIITDYKL